MVLFSKPQRPATSQDILSYDEIRQKTYIWFSFYPCLWQIRVVEAILKHDKDIISVAATGAGKTLTFWMPLLFDKGSIQVVVTPLNILGDQNINDLKARGVSGIAIQC
jgi:superfamily II DNA or RNA helicase